MLNIRHISNRWNRQLTFCKVLEADHLKRDGGGGRKNKNRAGETERKNFVHQKCLKEKNSGETFQKQFLQELYFRPLQNTYNGVRCHVRLYISSTRGFVYIIANSITFCFRDSCARDVVNLVPKLLPGILYGLICRANLKGCFNFRRIWCWRRWWQHSGHNNPHCDYSGSGCTPYSHRFWCVPLYQTTESTQRRRTEEKERI